MAVSFHEEVDAPEYESIAAIAENLVYRLRGCSDVEIRKTLRDVYRDFCRRTGCLVSNRIVEVSRKNRRAIITSLNGGKIDAVTSVTSEYGFPLECGKGYKVSYGDPTVVLISETAPDGKYFVESTEIPGLDSERAPSWLIQKYGDVIADGVYGRLALIPERPWSDPSAQTVLNKYEISVSDIAARSLTNGQFATPSGNGFGCVSTRTLV